MIGVPHDKWGEEVKAVVVLHEGKTVSAEELIDFVKQRKGSLLAPKTVEFWGRDSGNQSWQARQESAQIPFLGRPRPDGLVSRWRYGLGEVTLLGKGHLPRRDSVQAS